MATAQLNGVTIGYDDTGDGEAGPSAAPYTGPRPALVLLHGHPFDRSMWAPQREAFAGTHRVITPDLRGYGDSTVAPGTTDFATFAEDVAALLDHLDVGEFALGGLSMGGQLVMECHRLFPERLTGLLLADTFPAAETPEGKATRNAQADRLLSEGMQGYADEVRDKMVAPYNTEASAYVHRMMLAAPPEGAAAALRGRAERPDYRAMLTRVAVPSLVVVGRDDTYTPVSDAEAMHAALPDSALCVVEGAAHLPNLERPTEFNAAVRTWLNRLPTPVPTPGPAPTPVPPE
ncbi:MULTISPECIES: alpha/beta fold hydrolase [Streptomyces]|uniref:alpha/beta fold hydrolase n=1 Tax=Streptomyces TaxID=1883 RepID=UPI001E594CC8|nr:MULTISPECIES: alpha/beta fold hydrolase [Streptomyces]UFQ17192.1 alpha/beta hydrolase [Streptomyces huasconensis]WCL86792.1 alpha/beta fold hydrolase [Streptomyces sp. JCM 35825]